MAEAMNVAIDFENTSKIKIGEDDALEVKAKRLNQSAC
jgi:hypothetical protein